MKTIIDVKIERNRLLRESDYLMTTDVMEILGTEKTQEAKEYRAALRSADDNFRLHGSPQFPEKPSFIK